ncbi:MAG: glutamate racemase [Clostridia bacterium]|nr:glutamate racemase [Clostridia bacterium]
MKRKSRRSPIGVFDSGVGGISVLKVLRETLPRENFLYYGDSANAPYGEKTALEVRSIAEDVTEKLLAYGVKAIVIACNTATSAAAGYLREKYPDVPIIGMEPAIKPASACAEHPRVLVMATPLTLKEEKFRRLEEHYENDADFIEVPCHGLVELIERGVTEGEEMDTLLHGLLDPHLTEKIDAAVLGCTHYPHARGAIEKVLGEDVKIFDGSDGTSREVRRRLDEEGLTRRHGRGRTVIVNSSDDADLLALSAKLLEAK